MSVQSAAAKTLADQKDLLASAAVLQTGQIANKQLGKLAGKHLPMPMNMLAQTPMGALVLANVLKLAAEQFRPGDATVERLVNGMVVAAYSDLIATLDLDGLIDDLLSNSAVKRGLKAQAEQE
ncbi:hypothetical protein D3C75_669590 [compost metagenome]